MFNQTNNDEAQGRRASEVPVVVWKVLAHDLVGCECIKVPRDMQSLRK